MRNVLEFDLLLLVTTLALVTLGVAMVYSTSGVYAEVTMGDQYYFIKRQLVAFVIGIAVMVCATYVDYHVYRKLVYPILALVIILLIAVLMPGIGTEVGGARRWIRWGAISFQPMEFAKAGFVMYLAHSLVKKGDSLWDFKRGLLPHLLIVGVIVGLFVLEPDFGTAIVLLIITFVMLLVAGARPLHMFAVGFSVLPFIAIAVLTAGYRMRRMMAFIDPWKDPLDSGFQIIQSFIAFGSGGVTGVGIGMSSQKLFFLPEAHTDFIFAIVGEELGLVGVLAVVAGFVILITRGLRAGWKAPDLYGTYLAVGLTLVIGLQAVINMGVVTGLLPTKGLTLPFFSYGGTSLMMSLFMVGVLLNISAQDEEAEVRTSKKRVNTGGRRRG